MKLNIAIIPIALAVSLSLVACSNGQTPTNDAPPIMDGQTAATNPGAGDSDQPVSDTWITTKVKAELATTLGMGSTDVSVKSVNGAVTLTGTLDSDAAVNKAVAAARSVQGVRSVDTSGLRSDDADPSQDSDQPVSDTWITTKVKAELATAQGVGSTDITVKTVNGVVTLTGVLESDTEVKKAVAAANSVKGVKDVDTSGLKSM